MDAAIKTLIDTNPGFFERQIIVGMMQNQGFFRKVKPSICPLDPKTQTSRHDFTTRRYNFLLPVIHLAWGMFGEAIINFPLPKEMIKQHIVASAERGVLAAQHDIARELLEELDSLYPAEAPSQALLAGLMGESFVYWLDCRIARTTTDLLFNQSRAQIITMADIQSVFDTARRNLPSAKDRCVSAADFMTATMLYRPSVAAHSLPMLMKTMAGGFRTGETTMIAGTNGGGKTVLATQLARDFALQGIKTAYVTTEQKPAEMFVRLISSHLNVGFDNFTTRPELIDQAPDKQIELKILPPWLFTDGRFTDGLAKLGESLQNLQFIDWSEGSGLTVTGDLMPEIEGLQRKGFDPQIIIFDWIGSALDHGAERLTELRHLYQQAADGLINFGKSQDKIVIVMAQFDKVAATNKEKPGMRMLSECKTMSNNISNFIGITSLLENGAGSKEVFRRNQFLYVEKARKGTMGSVPVEREFEVQRFKERKFTN